jgi:hypothetical protein
VLLLFPAIFLLLHANPMARPGVVELIELKVVLAKLSNMGSFPKPDCKRRSNNPSLKRPDCLAAPEQNSVS